MSEAMGDKAQRNRGAVITKNVKITSDRARLGSPGPPIEMEPGACRFRLRTSIGSREPARYSVMVRSRDLNFGSFRPIIKDGIDGLEGADAAQSRVKGCVEMLAL